MYFHTFRKSKKLSRLESIAVQTNRIFYNKTVTVTVWRTRHHTVWQPYIAYSVIHLGVVELITGAM